MTITLQLVRGVEPLQLFPGTNDAVETIDLINPDEITIDPDGGWVPGVGQAAARFAESGDVLLAAPITRVTETMRLLVKASSAAARATLIQRLNQFARDAERLHIDQTFTKPVYLKWQPPGATKLQYALVYSINLSATADLVGMEEVDEWSLEIVREGGWRAVAPGSNPKRYWSEVTGLPFQFGGVGVTPYTLNNPGASANRFQIDQVVASVSQPTSGNAVSANVNYVTVPPTTLIGDLPSLVHFSIDEEDPLTSTSATLGNTVMIGKWSRDTSIRTSGNPYPAKEPCFDWAASYASTLGTDASLANDNGASGVFGSTRQRVSISFATTTLQTRLTIPLNSGISPWYVFPGTYRIFLRARLSAVGTANIQLTMGNTSGAVQSSALIPLTDVGTGGTGDTGEWYLMDMGVFTLPLYGIAFMQTEGTGLGYDEDLRLRILASRTSGTPALYLCDVIFMPLDEGALTLTSTLQTLKIWNTTSPPALTSTTSFIYDNTGHWQRGLPEETGIAAASNNVRDVLSIAGAPLTITPGRENRFPLVVYNASTRRSLVANSESVFNVRMGMSFVPRWLGRRT